MYRVAACLLLGVACGDSGGSIPSFPDAPHPSQDATTLSDAPSFDRGVTVDIRAQPTLPGQVRSDVTVTSATFRLRSLEVIGDAGSSMTTIEDLELTWAAVQEPPPYVFPNAPPALYSKIALDVSGDTFPSYEIRGQVVVDNQLRSFLVTDNIRLQIEVSPYSVTLLPGDNVAIPVRLDLEAALDLNWTQLRDDNGTLTLDQDGGAAITRFRMDLERAFKKL